MREHRTLKALAPECSGGFAQFSQGAEVDAGNGMGPDASLEPTKMVRVPSQTSRHQSLLTSP